MKPALQIRLNQTLALTPQLQQAIRLLQLSSMELELELNTAIESNPLLELEADREDVDTGEAETIDGVESAPETPAEAAESAEWTRATTARSTSSSSAANTAAPPSTRTAWSRRTPRSRTSAITCSGS